MNKHLLSVIISLFAATSLNAQTYYTRNLDIIVNEGGSPLINAWTGGMNSMQFSKMDFNDDGIDDLFCYDRAAEKIITYLNNGTANQVDYVYAPEYEGIFPDIRNWAFIVDYNFDGKEDVLCSGPVGVSAYKNIGQSPGEHIFELVQFPFSSIHSEQLGNYTNVYVSTVDLPAFVDVDNDGDIDILTFGIFGGRIEYHKNLSMETYGNPDTLLYELYNSCWGNVLENASSCELALFDTCNNNGVSNPQLDIYDGKFEINHRNERHTGSTVTSFDMTGDGVKELLIGDISCTHIDATYNDGPTVNIASSMISQDTTFPNYDIPIDLWIHPGTFYIDINNDGVRDLLSSPNSPNQSENKLSVWRYNNTGNDSVPDFNFVEENFLQGDMIDVGSGAYPVYFDYDNDGLLDLFVGNIGYYDRATNDMIPSIAQYKNVGHDTLPEFTLITDDYEGISTMGFGSSIVPEFADLDNDGDKDMMVGDATGEIHYFENIAGAGNTADFVLSIPYYKDNNNVTIDVGESSIPRFADLDRDGDLDMLIGCKIGTIEYYDNIGTPSAPIFEQIESKVGEVDVSTIFDPGGYSVPAIYDFGTHFELYVGSYSGRIYHYDNIDNNLSGTFNMIDSISYGIDPGFRSAPTLADLNNDSIPDITIGNIRGGLWFFESADSLDTGIDINELDKLGINIYPNPTNDELTVYMSNYNFTELYYSLSDISGRAIISGQTIYSNMTRLDLSNLTSGCYILHLTNGEARKSFRIIKK